MTFENPTIDYQLLMIENSLKKLKKSDFCSKIAQVGLNF